MALGRGFKRALDFAYGIVGSISPAVVSTGNSATGAGATIIVAWPTVTLEDGTTLCPFSTTAPITVGSGSNAETVTPTGVTATPLLGVYNSFTITAAFANLHGIGDLITSGSFGLMEAVNYVHNRPGAFGGLNGGLVYVDGLWALAGGVTATITGNKGWANTTVLDYRGTTTAKSYAATDGANYAATAISLY